MSQLRSILEELVAFDPNDLSAEELATEITEASYGQQILQTAVAGWVKNLADRGGHHTLGYSSPTAFLVDQTGVSPAHAKRVIGYGNAAEKAPHAYQAWADGRLSTDQARYLFSAAEAVPDGTATPAPQDNDRHDALENLCRDWLDNGITPAVGGEKPQMIFHTDLPALQGIAGGLHETENGQIVDVDLLRMVACNCSITRIVLDPDSEVLDVGRKTRVWTPAQRRAIVARDRHCQGPGCRAKPRHCDIHHTDHWADGGTTSVDKGKLLCRPCHIQEHHKQRLRQRIRERT